MNPDGAVVVEAADGWEIHGLLRAVDDAIGAAVLVPGSRHERDAYASLVEGLAVAGIASLRIDVRGRGASLGSTRYARMGPLQRRRVELDVRAALGALDADRVAVVAEQDTAADAVAAAASDDRVRAVVLFSPRHGHRLASAIAGRPIAVFGLVSTEDREGLDATVDAYLAGDAGSSRLEIFRGLGFGTTMCSTRLFEHPDEEPLEAMTAGWLAERVTPR